MKILADAHISRAMLAFLQAEGHDVLHAATLPPAMSDEAILDRAATEGRVVLTADKDLGELVFRQMRSATGVVLLRITAPTEVERVGVFRKAWPVVLQWATGHFVVVTDTTIRRTPLPVGDQ